MANTILAPAVIDELRDPWDSWTLEQRTAAVKAAVEAGNVRGASQVTGVPEATLRRWLKDPAHRAHAMREVRLLAGELLVESTGVLRATFRRLAERMELGDEVVVRGPDGPTAVRVAVKARDLAVVMGVLLDKQTLLMSLASQGDGLAPHEITPELSDDNLEDLEQVLSELRRRRAQRADAIDVTPSSEEPSESGA